MNDLLFAPPVWAPMILAVVAIVLIFTGNSRGNTRLKYAGVAVALLAVLYWVVSGVVKTDKEAVTDKTRELLAVVDKRDWAAFEQLLDPKAKLVPLYTDRKTFLAGAKPTIERWNVRGISSGSIELDDKQPGAILADLQCFATIDAAELGSRPFRTNWRFSWAKNGDAWQCYEIRPMPGGDIDVAKITDSLVRGAPRN